MTLAAAAIALIAKAPEAGRVKTRLCPPLTPAEAATVAKALLLDSQDAALATGADVWCAFHGDEVLLRASLAPSVRLLRQRGGDLAERLAAAQADLFAAGYQRVLLYGADCPTVGPGDLRAALGALEQVHVALGPAADGGYTVLASRLPTPELFAGVRMSTERALSDTLARADHARLSCRLLQSRRDFDTAADLVVALECGELDNAPRTHAAARMLRRQLGVGEGGSGRLGDDR